MKRDEGYAWIVLLGVILNGALMSMAYAINGVFILEYSQKYGVTSDVIMWVGALRMGMFGFGGLMTGQIVHRLGNRTTGVLGSILIVFCNVVSSMYTNIYFLYFTYGIVNGLGYSCLIVSSTVAAQQYFYKRRALAGGLLLAGQSVGTFLFPPLINYLYSEYGLNGAILLEGGIILQGALFSMLFRPFVPDEEMVINVEISLDSNGGINNEWKSMPTLTLASSSMDILSCSRENINVHSSLSDVYHRRDKKYLQKTDSDELLKRVLCKTPNGTNIKTKTIAEGDQSIKPILNPSSNHDPFTQKQSTPNLVNHSANTQNLNNTRESRQLCEVLHNKAFIVATVGGMFGQAGHIAVFSLLPLKGVEIGASRENAALLLSIVGISNIFLRGLGGFISDFKLIAPRRVLFSGITYAVNGVLCLLMTGANSFIGVAFVVAVWGCLCAYYASLSGTIVRDLVGSRFMAVAYGFTLSIFAVGWFSVMIGSGYLLTKTGRSLEAFILCGACQVLGGLLGCVSHFMLQKQRQDGDND